MEREYNLGFRRTKNGVNVRKFSNDPLDQGTIVAHIENDGDEGEVTFYDNDMYDAVKEHIKVISIAINDPLCGLENKKAIRTRPTGKFCPRCGQPIYRSTIKEYTWQCFHCDEDFYGFEID